MSWKSCWCQKLREHIKMILYLKFETKRIQGRYFMGLCFFNKVVWFVLAPMLEGIFLPSNMAAKTTFCLYFVKCLIVTYAQMCSKRYHIIFSKFSLKSKCKICVQKDEIHKKNHILVSSYKLSHFKKIVWVWKTKSLLFCLRYEPL